MKHSYFTALILIGVIAIIAVGSQLLGIRLYDRIATNLLISLVLVIGLQTFMGNSGLLSFAHIGFMGLGAYTSAVLTIPAQMKGMALPDLYDFMKVVEVSPLLAMLAAGVLAAVVAAVVAYPLMRLSDAASVITSFALLVVLYTVMNNWSASMIACEAMKRSTASPMPPATLIRSGRKRASKRTSVNCPRRSRRTGRSCT